MDNWRGLYREGWGKNRLRPESFAHPAKCSYGLSVRIYEHAIEEGWIAPGQTVLDPFAGIGGFALEAMRHGLHFVGCELEQRFVDMGQGCDCTGISKADWVRFQGRWDKMRYEDGRYWCPECIMKASAVMNERKFKPLPLPGTRWGAIAIAIAKARQPTLFDAAPSTSYVRNSGKIPWTGAHHYRGNIETWERQGMAGSAVIVQGDSRRLGEVLERARLCLSSPPYARSNQNYKEGFSWIKTDRDYSKENFGGQARYGESDGQLAAMPDTGFEAALSPPVHPVAPKAPQNAVETPQGALGAGRSASLPPEVRPALALGSPPYSPHGVGHDAGHPRLDATEDRRRSEEGSERRPAYGSEPGQLAQMPEGDLAEVVKWGVGQYGERWQDVVAALPEGDHAAALEAEAETGRAQACISSPPFEGVVPVQDKTFWLNDGRKVPRQGQEGYGATIGQLGQETGSTFWAASRQILEQVYQVLAPGGHAIWVVKMFVRNKQLVDFPGQWETLCQSVGFKTVCKHRAWMNKNAGVVQVDFDGEEVSMEKWFKSFFRRLCESKGSPRIDWELVLCMEKPIN